MEVIQSAGSGWMIAFLCSVLALFVFIVVFIFYRNKEKELRKQLEQQQVDLQEQVIKAREAVHAKSDFLSRMSHEIRTPLNAIVGMAQISRSATTLVKVKNCMDQMENSSKHLLGVINDILDFSKIESGNLELEEKIFSLRQDIDFVIAMLQEKAKEKGLELRTNMINIENDGIVTDMLRLNQVLINLLSNAVKFTDAGGRVSLSVEEMLHSEGESVFRFSVEDTGIGIALEQAKKLFTPFTQANAGVARVYGGTGLGLAISQSIVQMMGGDIELETEEGKGSLFQFTIRVPAQEEANKLEENAPVQLPPEKLRGKRLLVVDDISINRDVVAALLENSGVVIEMANNGKEALDAFCENKPYWYHLILMDMQMPVLDGCAATQEIRDSGKEDAGSVPILAMTANVLKEDVKRAFDAGMNGYLTKPIDVTTFFQAMEEWL